jgi:hypothetical protein
VSATSNSFKIYAAAGVLGCDASNNTGQGGGTIGTPGSWELVRASTGGNNPDGSTCIPVPYSFAVDSSNNITNFTVPDKFGQQYIAVEYTVFWAPVYVDAYPAVYAPGTSLTAGWTQRRPFVAYGPGLTNPPTYPGQFVPALACVIDDPNAAAFFRVRRVHGEVTGGFVSVAPRNVAESPTSLAVTRIDPPGSPRGRLFFTRNGAQLSFYLLQIELIALSPTDNVSSRQRLPASCSVRRV